MKARIIVFLIYIYTWYNYGYMYMYMYIHVCTCTYLVIVDGLVDSPPASGVGCVDPVAHHLLKTAVMLPDL